MKRYASRKKGTRKIKNIVVIVCEGKKTEPLYFNGFKKRYSGVQIETCHEKCTDPKNITNFARKKIKEYGIDFSDGDGVWCVFDVNSTRNEVIVNAIEYAQNRNIQIALSNPCIELWFLLHFKYQRSNISRSEALEEIRKHIKDYEKKGKVFTFLEDKLPRAIKHAKQLNEMHERDGTPLLCCNSNPSSQIFELVEFIQYLIDKNTNN